MTSAKIFIQTPNAEGVVLTKIVEVIEGEGSVKQIFPDKEDKHTLVVVLEDDIIVYTGFPFIIYKERKTVEVEKHPSPEV